MKQKRQHGDPRRNYAKEWRDWREAHGLTRAQFALALGICVRAVEKIEGGHCTPRTKSRMKMEALQKRYSEAQA